MRNSVVQIKLIVHQKSYNSEHRQFSMPFKLLKENVRVDYIGYLIHIFDGLFEIIIFWSCKQKLYFKLWLLFDFQVIPSFVELALQRLTREVSTSELRTMCLQVVIAALYYNLPFLMDTLTKLQIPNVNGSLLAQFLKSWFHDVDCFVG